MIWTSTWRGNFDEFLEVDSTVSESGFRFGGRLIKSRLQRIGVRSDSHPFATAACGRFDQHGIADFGRDLETFVFVGDQAGTTGHDRDFGLAS